MSDLGDRLRALNACEEACEWADGYDNSRDAWAACDRGDWMLWLLGLLSGQPESESRRRFVLALCACVRLSLEYVPDGEPRPRGTIETAERWARYEEGVTLRDVRIAAASAASAAYGSATYAAFAAAYAATAAYAHTTVATYAAHSATCAANSANSAVHAAGAYADRLRKCADIVREHYPTPPELPEPTAKEHDQ